MTKRPPFTDRETLLAWLNAFSPADRVHVARLLGDTKTTGALAAAADATVYDMTRDATAAAVAEQLELSVKQVRRAVEQHAARMRAQTAAD